MKIFSTIIVVIISIFSATAQQVKKEIYLTQPDLERFTGGWQYVSHDTTFLINLKLVKTYVKGEGAFYIDLIQGDYTIKKVYKYCNHLLNVALFIQEDMWIKV